MPFFPPISGFDGPATLNESSSTGPMQTQLIFNLNEVSSLLLITLILFKQDLALSRSKNNYLINLRECISYFHDNIQYDSLCYTCALAQLSNDAHMCDDTYRDILVP